MNHEKELILIIMSTLKAMKVMEEIIALIIDMLKRRFRRSLKSKD